MKLDGLPPELIVSIFANLPLGSLRNVPFVCKEWCMFFLAHENSLFHNAALFHGFASLADATVEDAAVAFSRRAIGGATDWKDLCRKRLYIEQGWTGHAPTSTHVYHATGIKVHRIKLDERDSLLIHTNTNGGLAVASLERTEKRWSLPQSYVRSYAHLEYTQGFIVFDRFDGSKEVWRRVWDFPSFTQASALNGTFNPKSDTTRHVVPESQPSAFQIAAGDAAAETYSRRFAVTGVTEAESGCPASRFLSLVPTKYNGHFRPWARLEMPNDDAGRAFRLADNFILGVAASERVHLWDVRTGALVQTIQDIQSGVREEHAGDVDDGENVADWSAEDDTLGGINYIELNDEYVFLCGGVSLRVYDRKRDGKCVLHVLPGGMVGNGWFTTGDFERGYQLESAERHSTLVGQDLRYHGVTKEQPGHGYYDDSFNAIHVSACGSHLAIATANSRLILIPHFKRCLSTAKPRIPIHEVAVEIILGDTIWDSIIVQDAFLYLAFTGKNISVATSNGIYVIRPNWDGLNHKDIASFSESESNGKVSWDMYCKQILSVSRVPQFIGDDNFERLSCLQLSETALFTIWDPADLPWAGDRAIVHQDRMIISVDFWPEDPKPLQSEIEEV